MVYIAASKFSLAKDDFHNNIGTCPLKLKYKKAKVQKFQLPLQEQYPEANDKDQLLTVKWDQNSYKVVAQGAQPSKTRGKKPQMMFTVENC